MERNRLDMLLYPTCFSVLSGFLLQLEPLVLHSFPCELRPFYRYVFTRKPRGVRIAGRREGCLRCQSLGYGTRSIVILKFRVGFPTIPFSMFSGISGTNSSRSLRSSAVSSDFSVLLSSGRFCFSTLKDWWKIKISCLQ